MPLEKVCIITTDTHACDIRNTGFRYLQLKQLTILLCTHNRTALLEKTLSSLNQATRPTNWLINILVIANACTDKTLDVLENYQSQQETRSWLPLTWLEEKTPGKSHALNLGISESSSDMIAFEDDDQRVDKSYLAEICGAADSFPEATLFCGRLLPDWDGTESDWFHDTGPYRVYPFPVPKYDQGDEPVKITEKGPVPGGGNLFMRRGVLERVGEFSTELGPEGHNLGGGEDIDFLLRALRSGEQLIYIPGILQYHYIDPERLRLGYLMKKSFQRSSVSIRSKHKHSKVPFYLWQKLASYSLSALFSLNWKKSRFYLMRIAAVLGEIQGIRQSIQ